METLSHLTFREDEQNLCDTNGNCLPAFIGRCIPVFFFGLSFTSVLVSALDALQPQDLVEKVEAGAHLVSGLVPRVVGGLLVVLLSRDWSLLLTLLLLVTNSGLLARLRKEGLGRKSYSRLSSCLCSLVVPVLVKKRISDKERGIAQDLDPADKVRTQKTLGLLSIVNIIVFLLLISALFAVVYFSPSFKTDLNNVFTGHQMMEIFQFIFLPSAGLAIISSVVLCLIPAADRNFVKVKMIIDMIIIIAAIVLPILSGVFLLRSEPYQEAFIFVKVRER